MRRQVMSETTSGVMNRLIPQNGEFISTSECFGGAVLKRILQYKKLGGRFLLILRMQDGLVVVVECVWNELDGVKVELTGHRGHDVLVASHSLTDQRLAGRFLCQPTTHTHARAHTSPHLIDVHSRPPAEIFLIIGQLTNLNGWLAG